jgi:hypothetical protein
MSTRTAVTITLALAIGAGGALAQGAQQGTKGGSVALTASLATLVTEHDVLAAEFRRVVAAASSARATGTERAAVGRFVRTAVVPQLEIESVVLYPAFDSIVGGGYAVPANLFDLDAIAFLVKEAERTATGARAEFDARVYALSTALETYFTKTQLLVLPVLNDRLSGTGLASVVARLAEKNAP